jgi:hypothetical protein
MYRLVTKTNNFISPIFETYKEAYEWDKNHEYRIFILVPFDIDFAFLAFEIKNDPESDDCLEFISRAETKIENLDIIIEEGVPFNIDNKDFTAAIEDYNTLIAEWVKKWIKTNEVKEVWVEAIKEEV